VANTFFSPNFMMGSTIKYLVRGAGYLQASASDQDNLKTLTPEKIGGVGQGVGADLGMSYIREGRTTTAFGLTVQDIADTKFSKLSLSESSLAGPKPIVQTINVGSALMTGTRSSKIKMLFDFRDLAEATKESIYKRTHI
jgi:hypothetical protein